MKTITTTANQGNTLIGALMTAFGLKSQREIRHNSLLNTYTINGVDYDVFLRDGAYLIVEAE